MASQTLPLDVEAQSIRRWRIRRIIQQLSELKACDASLITIAIPSNDQLDQTAKLLTEEMETASVTNSSQTQNSVQQALVTAQSLLSLYSQRKLPPNGLVLYCGLAHNHKNSNDSKENNISICFEPIRSITNSRYQRNIHFITDFLEEMLNELPLNIYGIVVISDEGALLAKLGNTRADIVQQFSVDIRKKPRRGGASTIRFHRIRREKFHNYFKKIAEICETSLSNVDGVIVGGKVHLTAEFVNSDLLDIKIKSKIKRIVDIQYGGKAGLHETIKLCSDLFTNLKLINETKQLDKFFDLIKLGSDSGSAMQMYAIGVDETMLSLNLGADLVDKIILWENLIIKRFVYKLKQAEKEIIIWADTEQKAFEKLKSNGSISNNNKDIECLDEMSLVEWFADNYTELNIKLILVNDYTQEGQQFKIAFDGIASIFRYPIATSTFNDIEKQQHEQNDIDDQTTLFE
ncbi:unnamed protein product [Didymodactylos carnosus]|uniref:Eukaryotic peptide chain release factor subunit 1 n=1 Tax=Didymodactylos carnosus TaxID=1234261 RepID=A0A814U3J2_9BILA|nr:unnamed protein product [Didymodactylos carnosus]CAF1363901.1 unnamed protein product [Didymodactylos carnosus]CAF3934975.1 unnamed protein product [Didymodactylos carnosus]CAF4173502.1 unnamed protein product [Didymodactylos carnosus]